MSRKISDHNVDLGSGRKGTVFPEEVKVKSFSSADGAGKMMDYPDTIERTTKVQEMGISKIKANPMKSGYRQ
ncbi:hypothetical protein UFOVP255_18 [uncultured Caudovirales phage]|uniref:Uncharacterized protein n=1 Tax=uncultured Caudovirales phage TaxID=2100421 RepID=A0A6J5LLB2_9CAUD|nr:hypothetical protein UFOVP255_18 [uncultured Caudovirales phage]